MFTIDKTNVMCRSSKCNKFFFVRGDFFFLLCFCCFNSCRFLNRFYELIVCRTVVCRVCLSVESNRIGNDDNDKPQKKIYNQMDDSCTVVSAIIRQIVRHCARATISHMPVQFDFFFIFNSRIVKKKPNWFETSPKSIAPAPKTKKPFASFSDNVKLIFVVAKSITKQRYHREQMSATMTTQQFFFSFLQRRKSKNGSIVCVAPIRFDQSEEKSHSRLLCKQKKKKKKWNEVCFGNRCSLLCTHQKTIRMIVWKKSNNRIIA